MNNTGEQHFFFIGGGDGFEVDEEKDIQYCTPIPYMFGEIVLWGGCCGVYMGN